MIQYLATGDDLMGFDDYSGEIRKIHVSQTDYMTDCLHFLNSLSKKTSTYKYAFF